MNARSQVFELTLEGRQADEAVASIFHTVLFHRTLGKFCYTGESSYSVSTLGFTDVDCDFIDLTYVCCTSNALSRKVKQEISNFSEQLRSNESSGVGQISLEFFQTKRSRYYILNPECLPWEVWTVRLQLISLENEGQRQLCRERVGEHLTDKILYITEVMNRQEYVPKMPSRSEVDLVFDTTLPDVQPYLFKVNYSVSGPSAGSSVGSTVRKFIKSFNF
ncbi:autophagy-related protein 101 [Anthonomus grandis grandis]|uniref:autophagy-related protein 101 n=1 Tax=Anthonomus grandis grandis TaxID=2921223 RepID=UPI002166A6D6|nr:autophagy-related protein 101 [Anthonomus grandis grandis]XP_050311367.1 autophagy-related protein 101 [Anthonomus grandis grandis]XP_050311368.1 autophagy-related protein 101 [Anthonomus grandis grandis]XP_050311369.1 autophagy-related protein 101 [Anthonomus grandis grandis]XP_050311370.1 autophagy-related protein 101 [Anthonomus grandis grandis]XP_050311371.1 autophagy-related protein 101 [Anthonomus grandis grandis]XP_050311372.1 autophagy-related protein 101 [Anthonomus grandis grandi